MENTFINKLFKEIRESEYKDAFSIFDFRNLPGNYEVLKKSITRLEKRGLIKRIIRGIYYLPTFNKELNLYTGYDLPQVANCIARKNSWIISPFGERALNILKLTTQVPNQYIYASSGPNTKFNIDGKIIEFKHRSKKELYSFSETSRLVIQAFKAIGRNRVNKQTIKTIGLCLNKKQKNILLNESKNMFGWMERKIKQILKYE